MYLVSVFCKLGCIQRPSKLLIVILIIIFQYYNIYQTALTQYLSTVPQHILVAPISQC